MKTTISSYLFLCIVFKGTRCESGIVMFACKVTWNYAYSPFNNFFKIEGGTSVYPVPVRMLPELATSMPPTQGVTVTGKKNHGWWKCKWKKNILPPSLVIVWQLLCNQILFVPHFMDCDTIGGILFCLNVKWHFLGHAYKFHPD